MTFLRRLGQRSFLAVEDVFNRAFGERQNPLYYLGAISYFALAIVIASGLYVYAFYRTGVEVTYASVEAITHGQWYLGGVMRSLHRYASGAMVVTMLLHLVRHFTFDRYRSFRAFSWISGVVVLWLVYVSGINGYMLPWDRLAQFVATASAEWLDALPVFRGTLVRNFLVPESISDRLFSLLSFLHIGIPLALLAALWIHTQRVPRAHVLPPVPLAIGLTLMLLAVSIVKPAVSQGPADLASMAGELDIDWLYLPTLPLMYRTSPLTVWALLGGATVLMLLAPWLPPKRVARGEAFQLAITPSGASVPVRPGETLLDAALRADVVLPFECRSGGCGVCKATLVGGEVDYGAYQKSALSDAERAGGKLLLCCATALSDVAVECEEATEPAADALRYEATVEALRELEPEVMLVGLRLAGGRRMRFAAGQHVDILLPDGARRSYTLLTTEKAGEVIELHIRRVPGGRFTTQVLERMRIGDVLVLEGPLGEPGASPHAPAAPAGDHASAP